MPIPCGREPWALWAVPLCRCPCILEMSDPSKQQWHSHSEPSGITLTCFCSEGPKLGSSISCLFYFSPP